MSVGTEMRQDRIALDRSVRRVDQDGHLYVDVCVLSAASVCPYLGREIPDSAALGLDPDRVYNLYREPESLAAASASLNGKPVLFIHKPVSSDDHPHEIVVGSVGGDVRFESPNMVGSFTIWDGDAIAAIESGQMRCVSAGYAYRPVMQAGSVNGVSYDGLMLVEHFNHLAVVKEGRVTNAIIGDSAEPSSIKPPHNPEITMAKNATVSRQALLASGALRAYLRPKLAADAKVDITSALKGVTAATWEADKSRIKVALDAAVQGKLAQDADIEDLVEVLQALEPVQDLVDGLSTAEVTGSDPDPSPDITDDDSSDDDEATKLKAAGLTDEEIAEIMKMRAGNSAGTAAAAASDAEPVVTKAAMDAAIAAATVAAARNAKAETVAHMVATQEALRIVHPRVGAINVAMDSASAVYRQAFDTLGIDVTGVPEVAYAAFYRALPAPQAEVKVPVQRVALDAASVSARAAMFPNATRLAN